MNRILLRDNGIGVFMLERSTRYDKLAITYRAGVALDTILNWLQRMRDTP